MIYHEKSNKIFDNRKAAKKYVGGDEAYNEAHKKGEFLYVNDANTLELVLELIRIKKERENGKF